MPKRACDGCSIRKIRCEGIQPCRACIKAGLSCTFLKALRKGGPRKPSARTLEAIKKTQDEFTNDIESDRLHHHHHISRIEEETDPESANQTPLGSPRLRQYPGGSGFSTATGDGRFPGEALPTPGYGFYSQDREIKSNGIGVNDMNERYPISILAIYLEIYHHRLYPIWPILRWETLLADLEARPDDLELYILATSLASAVMGQLQLPQWSQQYTDPETQAVQTLVMSTEQFAAEASRGRRMLEWRENPSIPTLLTSLFFHVYYENLGKTPASSLALREAISIVQIMNLDREIGYVGLSKEESELRRRIFWLLFVTERGHSITHDLPFILNKTIKLPSPDFTQEPLLAGFMNLASLFASFDNSIINAWTSRDLGQALSKDILSMSQDQLENVHPHRTNTNEIQKADVLVTKHWMRTLVWQVSMAKGFLSSNTTKEVASEAMSLSFPMKIAEELLGTLADVSPAAIEAHGPGMQLKLFEISNSLADVLLCVPTAATSPLSNALAIVNPWAPTPLDYLKGLVDLMSFRTSSNPELLSLLLSKTSSIMSPPDPLRDQRLVELPNSSMPSPDLSPSSNDSLPVPVPIEDNIGISMPLTEEDFEPSISLLSTPPLNVSEERITLPLSEYYPPPEMMDYNVVTTPPTPVLPPIVSSMNSPEATPPTMVTGGVIGGAYFTASYGNENLITSVPVEYNDGQWASGSSTPWSTEFADPERQYGGHRMQRTPHGNYVRTWINDLQESV